MKNMKETSNVGKGLCLYNDNSINIYNSYLGKCTREGKKSGGYNEGLSYR